MHVFKSPDISFEKVGITGRIFPVDSLTNKVEHVLVDTAEGHETTIRQRVSDFTYYILEGKGYFEIDDVREGCEVGDLVVIPAGSKFTYKGAMKLLLTVVPPWTEEQEETL